MPVVRKGAFAQRRKEKLMTKSRGTTLLFWALAIVLVGCGTGNRIDIGDPGYFPQGYFLPIVHTLDIRLEAELSWGEYDGLGSDLTYPAETGVTSGTSFTIRDGTEIATGEQIYDIDGDGVIDYIVMTIRSLSAQARGNGTVLERDGLENPNDFFLVGGASFEPHDASFVPTIELNLPLSGSAVYDGTTLPVYKFNPEYTDNRGASADIGDGSGYWELIGDGDVAANGLTVSISVSSFGQYAVVAENVLHNQGTGGDI